tara:strand:- start:6999 stop:7445 length:447 start_codon:yes stop_codon:yes gene_type:complete
MIKVVIIDWARTIYHVEEDELFSDARATVEYLAKKYKLAIVSLAMRETAEERKKLIKELDMEKYFEIILIDPEDKDKLYEQAFSHFNLQPEEIAVIDDRSIRGIKWGNKKGCQTFWINRGKFKDELPNEETGQPTETLSTIADIKKFL